MCRHCHTRHSAAACGGMGRGWQGRREEGLPQRAQAAAGWKHNLAIGMRGQLMSWGWGGSAGSQSMYDSSASTGGQLGLDSENDCWAPAEVAAVVTPAGGTLPQQAPASEQADASFNWRVLQVLLPSLEPPACGMCACKQQQQQHQHQQYHHGTFCLSLAEMHFGIRLVRPIHSGWGVTASHSPFSRPERHFIWTITRRVSYFNFQGGRGG